MGGVRAPLVGHLGRSGQGPGALGEYTLLVSSSSPLRGRVCAADPGCEEPRHLRCLYLLGVRPGLAATGLGCSGGLWLVEVPSLVVA